LLELHLRDRPSCSVRRMSTQKDSQVPPAPPKPDLKAFLAKRELQVPPAPPKPDLDSFLATRKVAEAPPESRGRPKPHQMGDEDSSFDPQAALVKALIEGGMVELVKDKQKLQEYTRRFDAACNAEAARVRKLYEIGVYKSPVA